MVRVNDNDAHQVLAQYQTCCAVSANEAGQDKRLVVLNAEYEHVETIPLDVGPRHFQLHGILPDLPPRLRAADRCAAMPVS